MNKKNLQCYRLQNMRQELHPTVLEKPTNQAELGTEITSVPNKNHNRDSILQLKNLPIVGFQSYCPRSNHLGWAAAFRKTRTAQGHSGRQLLDWSLLTNGG